MRVTLFCLCAALLMTSGCTQPIYTTKATNGADHDLPIVPTSSSDGVIVDQPSEIHEAAVVDSPITAAVKSLEETDALIASLKGKIVVVDLWALW